MRRVIILTTEIKITSTMDASEQNEVFSLGKAGIHVGCTLAAIAWLCSVQNINESRLIVLRSILSLIVSKLVGFKIWLLVGNSAWQPDTRMIKHRGLWKALKTRGVEVSHFTDTFEKMHESYEGLKFFGAKLISELSAESVVQTIAEEHCAYILALPKDVGIRDLLSKGWKVDGGFDTGVLEFIIENDGLVLKAVGEFDDIESGFVGIAKPVLVKTLVQ